MMFNFLITLGGISLAMSAVIILMLALQKPIKKRFAALGRYIIWSVIIIRLCLPVSLDIMPKLVTLPADIPETEIIMPETVIQETVIPEEVVTPSLPSEETENAPSINNTVDEKYTPSASTAEPEPQKPAFEITGEHIVTLLFTVWAIGAVTFAAFTLVHYSINAKRLDRSLTLPSAEAWSIYDTVCRELGIKKAPHLYMGRSDVSPMVYGFISPKVVLPSVDMSNQTMTYILRHELTHYKRGDLYLKLIAMIANALHWFNPLAYIACGVMSAEAELSCDESALRKTDLIGRLGYGNSMLEIVKLCRHSPKLTTGFSPKKRAVKERFENMINTTKKKKGYWIVALITVAALLCTSLIGCKVAEEGRKPLEDHILPEERLATGDLIVSAYEDEDWRFTYKDEKLILTHKDGRHFEYGADADGVIGLEHVYKNEDVNYIASASIYEDIGVITYGIPPSDTNTYGRSCVLFIDAESGAVTRTLSYSALDIFEAHGMSAEDLAPYMWYKGKESTYYIDSWLEYRDNGIPKKIYTKFTTGSGEYVECFNRVDAETLDIQKTRLGVKNIVKGKCVTDIDRIDTLEGISEQAAACMRAFLNKDIAELERMAGYPSGMLSEYESLTFGNYYITMDNDKWPLLHVEITDSAVERIKPGFRGFYCHELEDATYMYYAELEPHNTKSEEEECACTLIDLWITYANEPLIPYGEQYSDEYYPGVMYMLNRKYHAESLEEYRNEAKRVFGIDILNDIYTDKDKKLEEIINLNLYTERHYYSPQFPHRAIECGDDYVIVEFFADYGYTVPAYKVRYDFVREGEDILFSGSEKLDDTGRDIRQLYSTENEAEIAE